MYISITYNLCTDDINIYINDFKLRWIDYYLSELMSFISIESIEYYYIDNVNNFNYNIRCYGKVHSFLGDGFSLDILNEKYNYLSNYFQTEFTTIIINKNFKNLKPKSIPDFKIPLTIALIENNEIVAKIKNYNILIEEVSKWP